MSSALHKIKDKESINLKRILQDKVKRIRLFLLLAGILFIGFSFYLSEQPTISFNKPQSNKSNSSEVTSFSQEPVKIDNAFLQKQTKDRTKSPPIQIIIPELNIDLPVKEAKVIKGYWEVFPKVAGWGIGSAYPGEVGNQVVFAHARKGMFFSLKGAKVGQLIYIFTKEKWFSYTITDIKEVTPDNISVISPTQEETLTLYTCTGFADSKRLIVIAKRITS